MQAPKLYSRDLSSLRPVEHTDLLNSLPVCLSDAGNVKITGCTSTDVSPPEVFYSVQSEWDKGDTSTVTMEQLFKRPLFWLEGKAVYKYDVLFQLPNPRTIGMLNLSTLEILLSESGSVKRCNVQSDIPDQPSFARVSADNLNYAVSKSLLTWSVDDWIKTHSSDGVESSLDLKLFLTQEINRLEAEKESIEFKLKMNKLALENCLAVKGEAC